MHAGDSQDKAVLHQLARNAMAPSKRSSAVILPVISPVFLNYYNIGKSTKMN
jgi:hypothetical protein